MKANKYLPFYEGAVKELQLHMAKAAGEYASLMEQRDENTGVVRAKVGLDSSPRGVAVTPVGWVTAEKDGERILHPISAGEAIATQHDSMAKRIARRRLSMSWSSLLSLFRCRRYTTLMSWLLLLR